MAKRKNNGCLGRGCIVGVFVALVFAALFVWGGVVFMSQPLEPGSQVRRIVNIPKGASAQRAATILVNRHVLRNRWAFLIAYRFSDSRKGIKPGSYELSPSMTPNDLLNDLLNGYVSMDSVTIPEGWTIEQIADRLDKHGIVDRAEFLQVARREGRSFTGPNGFVPPSNNLEGYLFPTTYRFSPHSDPHTVIRSMVEEFEKRVVDKQSDSVRWRKIITVASLIEREAEAPEDRPLIASVIYNRLRKGVRLQIDATVQYALPSHKSRLYYKDLTVRSPYNTYLFAGLPPGPICCPGEASIDAALAPSKTDYLYYVAGPGGRHIFTRSLAEHDAAISSLRAGSR